MVRLGYQNCDRVRQGERDNGYGMVWARRYVTENACFNTSQVAYNPRLRLKFSPLPPYLQFNDRASSAMLIG
jgi:hypothetical protein